MNETSRISNPAQRMRHAALPQGIYFYELNNETGLIKRARLVKE
jgi:hypothetical protein